MRAQLQNAQRGVDFVAQFADVPRKGQDEKDFAQFGGLDADAQAVKPDPAFVAGVAFDAKGEEQALQADVEKKKDAPGGGDAVKVNER